MDIISSKAGLMPHRTLRRLSVILVATPLIALAIGGSALPAPKWAADIVSVALTDDTVVIAGTANSPAGENSGNYLEILWGDGSAPVILPNFTGNGPWPWGPESHQYAGPGSYTITVTLLHASPRGNDRSRATDTADVTIPGPPTEGPPVEDPLVEDDPPLQVAPQGSVNVALGRCDSDADGSITPLTVLIAPTGSATVILSDGGDMVLAFEGDGGSAALAPGSFTWTATASDGFTLVDPVAGQLTVEDCPSVVLAGPPLTRAGDTGAVVLPARLAKTGPMIPVILAMSVWLAVAGWFLNELNRRKRAETPMSLG